MDIKKLELALDEVLKDCRDPQQVTGPDGLLKQLTKFEALGWGGRIPIPYCRPFRATDSHKAVVHGLKAMAIVTYGPSGHRTRKRPDSLLNIAVTQ